MRYKSISSMFLAAIACSIAFAAFYAAKLTVSEIVSASVNSNTLVVASRLSPLDASNYVSLSSITPSMESYFLQKAIAVNPWDAGPLVQLGLIYEADGNAKQAEKYLLEAARRDTRPATSWALVNFYYRQNIPASFFEWAARYRKFERTDTTGLFRLAWELHPDADVILSQFNPLNCTELTDFAQFLNGHPTDSETTAIDRQLAQCRGERALNAIMAHTSRLLAADQPGPALEAWNSLTTNQISRYTPLLPAKGASITNADFSIPFAENGFDWRVNRVPNVTARQIPQQHALEFAFSGEEPEGVMLLFQPIALEGGHTYRMSYQITGDNEESASGFRWRIVELNTGRSLPTGLDDLPSTSGNRLSWKFQAPESEKTLALALAYIRPPGRTRLSGTIRLSNVQLEMLQTLSADKSLVSQDMSAEGAGKATSP